MGETQTVFDTLFSIVCRTQRDIFGRSFHAVKILLEVPASRDWFLDLYVVVQSERRPEWRTDRKRLNWLLWNPPLRGRASQVHYVSGWTLRYALAGDRCALKHTRWQGWQNGPLKTPKVDGHRKMRWEMMLKAILYFRCLNDPFVYYKYPAFQFTRG